MHDVYIDILCRNVCIFAAKFQHSSRQTGRPRGCGLFWNINQINHRQRLAFVQGGAPKISNLVQITTTMVYG